MKTLVVAEKPSAARAFKAGLAKYGSFKDGKQCYISDKYIITWVRGHVLTLKEPTDYGYKRWSLNTLPIYPPNDNFEYKVNGYVKDLFNGIKDVIEKYNNEIELVINACDAEREGDLIFWEIYDYFKLKQPVKRFWESSVMTPSNIQNIIENKLKGNDFMLPRRSAAYGRQFADWLLGMNFTVGFTVKASAGRTLHIGRVQTPTLAIVVNREKEIQNFVVKDYFEIEANFGKYKGMWFKDKLGNTRLDTKKEAEVIVDKIQDKEGLVTKKEVKEVPEPHKFLYNMTALQQEASKKLGFSPDRTLEIAQVLYEKHKILSYPRTSSKVIGEGHVKDLPNILNAINVGEYSQYVKEILNKGIRTTKRFVDDSKLSDHHALIPTEVGVKLSALSPDEKNLFDLVVKRFLSVFYPDALYEKTEVETTVEGETFKTSGRVLIDAGWKVVYGTENDNEDDEDDEDKKEKKDATLPPIELNEKNQVSKVDCKSKKTQPPKRFTDAELLGIMENPKKLLEDKELQDVLTKVKAGLGTDATRANILKEIISKGYIQTQKKGKAAVLHPTEVGMKLIEVVPESLTSPEITAGWEQKLYDIVEGKNDLKSFMEDIRSFIEKELDELKNNSLDTDFANVNDVKVEDATCPDCNSQVYEKKFGKYELYVCNNHKREEPCFNVWKKTIGKTLTHSHIKQLCQKKETTEIKGFVKKDKTKFDAKLVWDSSDKKVKLGQKEGPKNTELICPFCKKGKISENSKAFGCSNWKEGCKFTFWKSGKVITEKVVQELIETGNTKPLKLKNKNGKEYTAKFVLNLQQKTIDRDFVND